MRKINLVIPLFFMFTPLAFAESNDLGIVYWKQEIVSSNSFAQIYVIDDDMNKKEYPNFADKFMIEVWSDTSPNGLEIEVIENGVFSGIFKGSVYVANSGETSKNRLASNEGDMLYAKYIDKTTPNGDNIEIISAAVVKIPGHDMNEILESIDPSFRKNIPSQNHISDWIKSNAGWWADGAISDGEFVSGIQHLIKEGIVTIPPTTVSSQSSGEPIPDWIKSNAGWWADGAISDGEFVSGIQHLIKEGIISPSLDNESNPTSSVNVKNIKPELTKLYQDLEKCSEISTAYKKIDCQKPIKKSITLYEYKTEGEKFSVGPITYYWKGFNSEGNEFSTTSTGQTILSIRILAENTSSEIVTINCTSPQICAYDVSNGEKEFKYSGMDFTSGQITMNPNDSREFNMLFGPNIGYGGTKFEYDSSKEYFFRINEDFGNTSIPLNLQE